MSDIYIQTATYRCPACGDGVIRKAPIPTTMVRYRPYRWACDTCGATYGANTPEPEDVQGWKSRST